MDQSPVKKTNILNSKIFIILLFIILFYLLLTYGYKIPLAYGNYVDNEDFGRDLYYYWLTSEGYLPYIHFNWIYGPLTPLLYGLFFKLFGVSAFNALTLWYIGYTIGVLAIFWSIKEFSNYLLAFLGAILLMSFNNAFLIHVFNHNIGTIFIVLAIFTLYKYLNNNKNIYLYLFSLFSCILCFVKLNIGISFYFSIILTILCMSYKDSDRLKLVFINIIFFVILLSGIYGSLIINSPLEYLHKSFPYFGQSHTVSNLNFIEYFITSNNLYFYTFHNVSSSIISFLYTMSALKVWYFVIAAFSIAIYFFLENKTSTNKIFVCSLFISILACSHEFFMIGTQYSLDFWVLPTIIILFTYTLNEIINTGFYKKSYVISGFLAIIFLTLVSTMFLLLMFPTTLNNKYTLDNDRLQIALTREKWPILTERILNFIDDHLNKDEKLATIPYDLIYNFLSSRKSPSRTNEFLYISDITPKEEQDFIQTLDKERIKYILNVTKYSPKLEGYGIFGETHCQKLYQYILDNYEVDNSFYTKYTMGYKIPVYFYKRKTPFKN